MLWYVAIIGAINLGLGYLWGAYVRPCPRCAKARAMGLSLLSPTDPRSFEPAPTPQSAANFSVEFPPPEQPAAAANTTAVNSAAAPTTSIPLTTPKLDPATGLVTREHVEQMLTSLGDDATLALVEMAPLDWSGQAPNPVVDRRMLCGVSNVVRQSLEAEHTVAKFNDQQLLVVVPHEDVQQATKRAEELRQRVATTEFVADGHAYQTTVTCALAQLTTGKPTPKLFEFLQEALDEAKRYGGNRTFMHDGGSPAPVVPAELHVSPQQLAI
jgi:GGDEF domain-containing protein